MDNPTRESTLEQNSQSAGHLEFESCRPLDSATSRGRKGKITLHRPASQSEAALSHVGDTGHQKPTAGSATVGPAACQPGLALQSFSIVQAPAPAVIVDPYLERASHVASVSISSATDNGVVPIPEFTALTATDNPPLTTDDKANDLRLPFASETDAGEITLDHDGELLTLSFRDAPLREVLGVLAESQGLNIICSNTADTRITGSFHSISFDDAVNTVLSVSGYTWTRHNNVIIVTQLNSEEKLAPEAQGRQLRVFTLNYLSAADVQKACTGLMSPSGTIVITEADPMDNQKTREQVLVEDLPTYIDRIAELICQIDVQPRQVLIEAHILEVSLRDESSNGVDFAKLGSIAGADILFASPGFNGKITDLSTFASPSYNIGIFNSDSFSGLIEALQRTTDAKTLASPKVLAINGQEAHVQIGKRLGYYVTTTTQTSTLQSVQFLDTGVVLTVTPRITDDNQILMTVKPEVSDGAVDSLGLPSSTTTEVDTTIMLPDGKGMVIGGLIKENDITRQQKIPVLGSIWGIGKLFRKNSVNRERSEIIIALVPRIVGGPQFDACQDDNKVQQSTTPLLYGPLERYPRPWEPKLPDAIENPRRLDPQRTKELWRHPSAGPPHHLSYYYPTDRSLTSETGLFESIPVYHSSPYPAEYTTLPSPPGDSPESTEPGMTGPDSTVGQ